MLFVITGGARSGKSAAAEKLALRLGGALVLVAAGEPAGDAEMRRRIATHKAQRGTEWRVVEPAVATDWRPEIGAETTLVLECLGTLAGRIMDETARDLGIVEPWELAELPDELTDEVEARLAAVTASCKRVSAGVDGTHVIVVTNEVGDGVVPQYPSGRLFRDALGRANRRLVDVADGAWLVVAGRCIDLSSLPGQPLPKRES